MKRVICTLLFALTALTICVPAIAQEDQGTYLLVPFDYINHGNGNTIPEAEEDAREKCYDELRALLAWLELTGGEIIATGVYRDISRIAIRPNDMGVPYDHDAFAIWHLTGEVAVYWEGQAPPIALGY